MEKWEESTEADREQEEEKGGNCKVLRYSSIKIYMEMEVRTRLCNSIIYRDNNILANFMLPLLCSIRNQP